jgi:hypothetical protein
MRRDPKQVRQAILIGLAVLLATDAALGFYSWKLASAMQAQQQLNILTLNRDLLRADIRRTQDIREKMPAIQKDCDAFEQSLFSERTGYSSVSAELASLGEKSGLRLESSTFRASELKGRSVSEVEIQAVVTGRYSGVVHFLNGLQRSKNVYAVESLTAAPVQSEGSKDLVRVTMTMKTYFRAA